MYSRGSGYGQQAYGGQSSYAQSLGNNYTGSSVGGADSTSHHSLASRHLSGSQEADLGGYKSSVSGYGGQYSGVYGSAGVSTTQPTERYERGDQSSILRQGQLLKSQSMHSSSLDGGARPIDYLAARGAAASRHLKQDLVVSYGGGRGDADPRGSSILNNASYNGQQHASSILGAAPRRSVDDLLYSQSLSNPGYGVSLPPGRDYGSGKGPLHGASLEPEYRPLHPRLDDRRDERAGYLREFELREEERRREFLREREKEREKEREREREREHERERERERRRDSERMVERREKERERKRIVEIRRERTPPRPLRDPRGSSLTREAGRSSRRDSMSQEASHRRHSSPVKDKRREYVCKVHGSCLVDIDRDYSSLDKRYPRLFVSPELSKVVVNWPKENLKLSLHTPVSFEHDFVEDEKVLESKDDSSKLLGHHPVKSENGCRVWNAKLILMSGVSKSAFEELSSAKFSDDRPAHICNVLRFALLKKDRAFMAIGGPWDPVDGGDPAVDDSPLIQTALRYAKDITQLDLRNCRHWNRFLEIHYDRFGKDGTFSHKEVTVLFVPDLSECLPSIDTWRNQWLAHKKAVAERERELSLRKERTGEKKEGSKDKGQDSAKDTKKVTKPDAVKTSAAASSANKREKDGNDSKDKMVAEKDADYDMSGKEFGNDVGNKAKDDTEKETRIESSSTKTAAGVRPGKKKIIKRIVKRKAVGMSVDTANAATGDMPNGADVGEKPAESDDKGPQPEGKGEVVIPQSIQGKPKDKLDPNVGTGSPVSVKTAVKKKIIKRVLKRKLTNKDATEGTVGPTSVEEKTVAQVVKEVENAGNQVSAEIENDEVKELKEMATPTRSLKSPENKASLPKPTNKTDSKAIKEDKDEKKLERKNGIGNRADGKADKQKGGEKDIHTAAKKGRSVDGEKTNDKDGKSETRSKSPKEVKEKRKCEDLPKHPGFILQTKCDKQTMLYSLSLSLDSLLDYTDKDTDESTVEKLRIKFVAKRYERKRRIEENDAKDKDGKSSTKRLKPSEATLKNESDAEMLNATNQPDQQNDKEEDASAPKNEVKPQYDTDEYEEDPELPEDDDEETEDPEPNMITENNKEESKTTTADGAAHGVLAVNETGGSDGDTKKIMDAKDKSELYSTTEEGDAEIVQKGNKGKDSSAPKEPVIVDKELLQAFRFFDRNRAGFVRVEDMRVIIHTLGKFLSHREVKELVQNALLESNTGRDDRILYPKLVKMNLS
ncbi:unnamed protein product [Linum tenue]|uniref:EF-hand domain-containing protein n=1 Tax=Linum tenue TaxID=586396 RepID=A0AAV0IX15_9ROSI|nr:unnamed protein product [Linum tenue]